MGAIINSNNIKGIYCGEVKIKTVYAGDKVVYKSDAIDPTYNYYVYQCMPNTGMHEVVLQNHKAGDMTEWDGYTDWGDGTRDKLRTHVYENPGIYTVKTKWIAGFEYLGATLIGCDNININITDAEGLFAGRNILEYADLSRLDTSKLTSMRSMFKSCWSLKELNMEGWDTSNVIDMSHMFRGCEKLTPQVSHFNTSKVVDFGWMFYGCQNLDGSQFKDWDTSSAEYMNNMFHGTKIRNTLDMSSWNMRNVINMSHMCAYSKGYDGYIIGYGISGAYVNAAFYINHCSYCCNPDHHVRHGSVSDSMWQKMIKEE